MGERERAVDIAANGIDLLEVRQTTGGLNDLLASYANYNAQRLPGTVTDTAGQSSTITYNGSGQVLTVTNAKNETTTYTYSPTTGLFQSVTGPVSGATAMAMDHRDIELALMDRAQHAGEHSLSMRATRGAISVADVPCHDGRSQGVVACWWR